LCLKRQEAYIRGQKIQHTAVLNFDTKWNHSERRSIEMTLSLARTCLAGAGHRIKKEERLSNNTGTRLRLEGGAIVNVFDNGNYSCEGKHYEVVEALLDRGGAPEKPELV
jgi:hypothetical protein